MARDQKRSFDERFSELVRKSDAALGRWERDSNRRALTGQSSSRARPNDDEADGVGGDDYGGGR